MNNAYDSLSDLTKLNIVSINSALLMPRTTGLNLPSFKRLRMVNYSGDDLDLLRNTKIVEGGLRLKRLCMSIGPTGAA
jgi:hypothetical protein